MNTTPAPRHHGIDYIELQSTDLSASKTFYQQAFGWLFVDYGPEYAGFKCHEGESQERGGLALANSVTTGGPLVVLYSQELESSQSAVRAAGGTVVKEIFSFPGGRRFEFMDPSGNRLAVWTEN